MKRRMPCAPGWAASGPRFASRVVGLAPDPHQVARLLLVLVWLWVGVGPAAASPLGDKVVEFCRDNLGRKVGNGQCAGLAVQALKAAGAKTRAGPDFPAPKDYVWGQQVLLIEAAPEGPKVTGQLTDVEPGDIIQYRDTKFFKAHFAHHTSVVSAVDPGRNNLKVYQQNIGGKKLVFEALVHLSKLSHGWLRIYRPLPAR